MIEGLLCVINRRRLAQQKASKIIIFERRIPVERHVAGRFAGEGGGDRDYQTRIWRHSGDWPQPRWATSTGTTATRKRYSRYVGTTRTGTEFALKWILRLEDNLVPIVYGVSGLWRHSRSAHLEAALVAEGPCSESAKKIP